MLETLCMIGCALVGLPLLYFTITYIKHLVSLRNYPAGLFPVPIIGNIHQLNRNIHKVFAEWSKYYGDVYSISFGMHRIVIINGYKPAMEALTKVRAFNGRETDNYLGDILSLGFKGIGSSDIGKPWAFKRKIAEMHI